LPQSADPSDPYVTALRRRLSDDSLHFFIPLAVRSATTGSHTAATSLTKLVFSGTEKRMAVLGNPGAGKTTLVKQLCTTFLTSDFPGLPIFIELKRYHPDRRDVRSLLEAQLREINSKDPHDAGLIVFDGLNEVQQGMIPDALAEIEDLAESQGTADTPVLLTCRTIDYPSTVRTLFSRYEVESPDEGQSLDYLEHRLGEQQARHLWDQLPPQMRSLCRSPLLLGMLGLRS
jgi:predicted NACHT family NTPase